MGLRDKLKWEVLQGSEGVHYFGNEFGDENCNVSSLVMSGEIER
jgi:hypothetical protein